MGGVVVREDMNAGLLLQSFSSLCVLLPALRQGLECECATL